MHDAPDVAQKDVIVARERTKLFDQGNRHCDLNQAIPYAGVDCFIGAPSAMTTHTRTYLKIV